MRFKRSLFVVGAMVFPVVIGATSPQVVEQARTFVVAATRPFLEFQNQTSHFFQTQIQYIVEWPKLRQENQALDFELKNLKAELATFKDMKRENARLETLLKLKENVHQKARAARVIGRDPSHWSQFIVINKGFRDGVNKNTVLVHPDGLVGKVVAAGGHSARAILLIDDQSRASAMNERTRDVGLVEGVGSFTLKMTYLDRQSDIQIGDIIVSSGLGGIYPKGIPIGKVELVGGEKNSPTLYAVVKPFAPFSKLEEVLCVPPQTNG